MNEYGARYDLLLLLLIALIGVVCSVWAALRERDRLRRANFWVRVKPGGGFTAETRNHEMMVERRGRPAEEDEVEYR